MAEADVVTDPLRALANRDHTSVTVTISGCGVTGTKDVCTAVHERSSPSRRTELSRSRKRRVPSKPLGSYMSVDCVTSSP